jgi:hypothetical protein
MAAKQCNQLNNKQKLISIGRKVNNLLGPSNGYAGGRRVTRRRNQSDANCERLDY